MKTFKTPKGTELPILDLRGKDYIQVAHRLVWFREERPLWGIETTIVSHDEKRSVCRATIKDETGRVLSTATKQEDTQGFKDHLEKCETGAIGRALALIGFGTQFAPDLDEGERIVDAPLGRASAAPSEDIPFHKRPAPELKKHAPGDPNGFIVPFGTNKDHTFEQVGRVNLEKDRAYWTTRLKSENKTASGRLQQYLNEIEEYFKTVDKQ